MVGIDPSRYDGAPKLSEETAVSMTVGKHVVHHVPKILFRVEETMFAFMVMLLILTVVHNGIHPTYGGSCGRE